VAANNYEVDQICVYLMFVATKPIGNPNQVLNHRNDFAEGEANGSLGLRWQRKKEGSAGRA
jgi:hypothetical protein